MVLSGTALLLAGSLLAAPASFADEARAAGPPDSARLAKLDAAFAGGAVARVRSASGSGLLQRVRVTALGVEGQPVEPARSAITSFGRERRLVSWSEIERVERRETWVGRGAKWGAAAGLVMGIISAANIRERWGHERYVAFADYSYPGPSDGAPVLERTIVIVGMPLLGAATGGFLGSMIPRWRTVGP